MPNLDDVKSTQKRSFWRIAHQYLVTINNLENSRSFKAPRKPHIDRNIKPELVIDSAKLHPKPVFTKRGRRRLSATSDWNEVDEFDQIFAVEQAENEESMRFLASVQGFQRPLNASNSSANTKVLPRQDRS
jgi:hypothetical protein